MKLEKPFRTAFMTTLGYIAARALILAILIAATAATIYTINQLGR